MGRALLNALDEGVVVFDPGMTVLFANAVAERDFDGMRELADAAGPGGRAVMDEHGVPLPVDQWPTSLALQGRSTSERLLTVSRGGPVRWLQVSAKPLEQPDGEVFAIVTSYSDVTDRVEAVRALSQSEAHFRVLAENSTDVIQRHALDGTCLYASPSTFDVFGLTPEQIVGGKVRDGVHEDDRERVEAHVREMWRTREPGLLRYRTRHAHGHEVWLESLTRPMPGRQGEVLEWQTSTRDITARVETEQRMARLALSDALTGLANRPALVQELEDLLEADADLALLFLDLDRFKVVNDSLGHSAGDELLRVLAGRLAGICRDEDVVARLGGDEFVVASAGLDESGALALTARVQKALSTPVELSGHELVVSASIGVVVVGAAERAEGASAEQLLRDADVSMYRAKARGRARAVVWTSEIGERAVTLLSLERDLRVALESGQLEVHYQPQVELAGGAVVGVEALVRWQHPTRGLLLPGAFLGVAGETGLITRLGEQVLAAAVSQVIAWRRLPGCADLHLSVNVSGYELAEPGMASRTVALLDAHGLDRGALTVEVLESVLLDAEGAVLAALADHAAHGVRLVLDDFGTGASSLVHLREAPVTGVKVDRAFVAGLGSSRVDEAIVRAVLVLARDLDLSCVAEGIETTSQREWLQAEGVVTGQGFLLHRPLPAEQVTALLEAPSMGSVEA